MRRTKRSCCCFLHFKQSISDCQIHAGSEICLNYRTPDLMLYHAIFRSNTLTEKKLLSYCNSNHKFTYQWSYLSRDVSCQTHESILQNTSIWNKAKSYHCFLLKEIMNNWEKQRKNKRNKQVMRILYSRKNSIRVDKKKSTIIHDQEFTFFECSKHNDLTFSLCLHFVWLG